MTKLQTLSKNSFLVYFAIKENSTKQWECLKKSFSFEKKSQTINIFFTTKAYWVGEGVRSRSSLSPERRKNSWSLYFNPWHKCWITRVFLRPIAFRICITLICGKCIWKEKNHVKAKKSTYFWSKTVKFYLHISLGATLSPSLWTPTIKFYT